MRTAMAAAVVLASVGLAAGPALARGKASRPRKAAKVTKPAPPPTPGDAVSTYRPKDNFLVADFGYEFLRLPGGAIAIKRAGQLGAIVASVSCGAGYVLLAKGRPGQINTVACDGPTPSAAALAPTVTLTP